MRAGVVGLCVAGVTSLALLIPADALATETPALDGTGVVTLVHAVPGLIADVSVDGSVVLTGFTASRVTNPVTLSAGKHTVSLKADNGPDAGKVVLTATLNITAGTTSTAVVGLTPSGAAKAYVFPEMPITVPSGQAAVVIRHVADTGVVKLVVDGSNAARHARQRRHGKRRHRPRHPPRRGGVDVRGIDPVCSIGAAAGRPGDHPLPDRQPAGQDTRLGGDD